MDAQDCMKKVPWPLFSIFGEGRDRLWDSELFRRLPNLCILVNVVNVVNVVMEDEVVFVALFKLHSFLQGGEEEEKGFLLMRGRSSGEGSKMMQRQFVNMMEDEQQPIAISLAEDSLISVQTSSDYLRGPRQEDCCEENAFCLYPAVQTLIGVVDLGAFYMQCKLIKLNNELKAEPLATFPGQKVVLFSFLLSLIFQEAFLWLERDSKRTSIFATLSFIGSIVVMSLVWFYQETHGRAYTGGTEEKVRALFLFFLWLLFLIITIVYVVRLTRLTYNISSRFHTR